ncbi:MAG: hypothetical protein QM737_16870 [Ferruginibacter sp.]
MKQQPNCMDRVLYCRLFSTTNTKVHDYSLRVSDHYKFFGYQCQTIYCTPNANPMTVTSTRSNILSLYKKDVLAANASFSFMLNQNYSTTKNNFMRTTFTKLAMLLVIVLTSALNLNAQVSNYTYTATTGTYNQLSGAGITTSTSVTGGSADDGYLLINLPFTFTYNKIAYTQVTATTNGVVVLGSSTNTNAAATDLFTTTAPTNAIAGWWGNLNLNSGNSGAIRHGLTGTNVYTIQFDQLSGAASGATSSTLKVRFQVSLYGPNSSNPGAVEILFGSATGAVQTARSIGIKSVTSAVVSYKNGLNGSSSNTSTAASYPTNGTLYRFTPPAVAYQAQFISMNLGTATWCAGETRNVTVTVKNIGTAIWTNSSPDVNIGLKWNLNGSNWTDYYIRTDANGLAPGATATYTLSVTASNNIGAGYTTPLAGGTNNITFDVVKEGDCWFGDNGGTCGPGNSEIISADQTIVGSPTAVAGTAVNTCSNSAAVNITAGSSATNAATTTWTSSGTGTFANATSLTTATYTPSPADITAGSVTLTLTSTPNSPCAANATSNKTLTINQAPTAVAGTPVTTCSTTGAVNITAGSSASNNASITWTTTNGTGSFSNATSPTLATYTPSPADITAGTRNLVLTAVGNAGCANVTSNKSITITTAPTAVAGTAVSMCSTSSSVNVTAGSSATNAATITWTSSGTGSFTNDNSLTLATYTPSAADISNGSVTLTLTSTPNSPCAANATSNKTLTIASPPTASAGGSQTICQNGTATVSGATSSNGTIAWTENGAGSITAGSTTLTPTYTAAAGDAGHDVILTMTVSNSPCTAATATYTVTVNASATAVAGTAVTTCSTAGAVNITAGSSSSNNAGILWTSNGTGTFANANSLTLATYDPSPADIAAGSRTLTLTATGNTGCANATSNKTITIRQQPTATAGGNQTICQNGTATVSGATSSNGTIAWTENGAGSITSGASTLTPTYTAAAGDAGNNVILTMTVSNSPCTAATATYTVTVNASATASAGTAIVTCANSGAVNITAGSSASNNAGTTWTSSGTGTFANANSLTLATYDPSAADIAAGSVTLTLTATGNTGCINATSNKTFTINPIPTTTGVTICQGTASQPLTSGYTCTATAPTTAGPNLAGAGANNGTGTAWSNPGNILTDNNSYATVSGTGTAFSQALQATGFGFTNVSIPSNATIKGIQVSIGRFRSGGFSGEIQDNSVRLLKAGTATGNNNGATSTNWPASEAVANYGSTTDLWGTTWSVAQVTASNFGVALVVDNTSGSFSRQANVDYINIAITYTVPGSLNWYTVSSGGSSIGSGSSFNPVGVLNSGLPNTNTAGTTIFYAECSTVAGCRTPTNYVITAAPDAPISGGDQNSMFRWQSYTNTNCNGYWWNHHMVQCSNKRKYRNAYTGRSWYIYLLCTGI